MGDHGARWPQLDCNPQLPKAGGLHSRITVLGKPRAHIIPPTPHTAPHQDVRVGQRCSGPTAEGTAQAQRVQAQAVHLGRVHLSQHVLHVLVVVTQVRCWGQPIVTCISPHEKKREQDGALPLGHNNGQQAP